MRFKSLPNVCNAVNIPTTIFFFAAIYWMIPAAMPEIKPNKNRLNQNIGHRESGIVNVICCQRVLGKTLVVLLIHRSVCFLPQLEQNLPLHVKATDLV